ncbi:hypothetical protein ACOMHN_056452 [Nucella lapillus]
MTYLPHIRYLTLTAILSICLPPPHPSSSPFTWAVRIKILEQDVSKRDLVFTDSVLSSFRARSLLECVSTCALHADCWGLTFTPRSVGEPGGEEETCTCYSKGTYGLMQSSGSAAAEARSFALKGCVESPCPDPPTTTSPQTAPPTTTAPPTATCPQPPKLSERSHMPKKAQYVTSDSVTYQCNDEKDGGGNGLSICNSDGVWVKKNQYPICD